MFTVDVVVLCSRKKALRVKVGINSALSENQRTFIQPWDHTAEAVCFQMFFEAGRLSQQRSGFCGNRWGSRILVLIDQQTLSLSPRFARTAVPTVQCTDWMQHDGVSCSCLQKFCLQVTVICNWPFSLFQMGEQSRIVVFFNYL